jgi:branched-subunit amino acid transport protein
MKIALIIIGMTLVTALPRILPFILPMEKYLPGIVVTSLRFVPVAALTALIVPGIFYVSDSFYHGLIGGITALCFSLLPKNNLILTITATFIVCYMANLFLIF